MGNVDNTKTINENSNNKKFLILKNMCNPDFKSHNINIFNNTYC